MTPETPLFVRQCDNFGFAGGNDGLPVLPRLFSRLRFDLFGHLRQDRFQFAPNICRSSIPEGFAGDQHIALETVVGLGDVGLQGLESLGIDVAPGVFLPLDQFTTQGITGMGE